MFSRKRTVAELGRTIGRPELVRRSRILVIDDEEPELVGDLRQSQFAVDYLPDIETRNISLLDQPIYDLILLDFGNVGSRLGGDQGLSILRHIKRTNPATLVLAYTSKALPADHADFFRLADGVLAKDAGVTESMEKIEEALQRAHGIQNIWAGLLFVAGVKAGSEADASWQDLAVRGVDKPGKWMTLKERILGSVKSVDSQKVALILVEKVRSVMPAVRPAAAAHYRLPPSG